MIFQSGKQGCEGVIDSTPDDTSWEGLWNPFTGIFTSCPFIEKGEGMPVVNNVSDADEVVSIRKLSFYTIINWPL